MNKFVIFALTATSFGGAGIALGYFLAKKKYTEIADREIESVKASCKDHDEWLLDFYGVKRNPNAEAAAKNATVTPSTVKPGVDRLDKEENQAADYVNYSKLAEMYSKGEEESQQTTSNNEDIYLISPREFNESDYSYTSLRYYSEDGIITDTEDNPISTFSKLIGDTVLWEKAVLNNDIAYVRNRSMKMDYEIVRCVERWDSVATAAQKASVINSVGETEDDD